MPRVSLCEIIDDLRSDSVRTFVDVHFDELEDAEPSLRGFELLDHCMRLLTQAVDIASSDSDATDIKPLIYLPVGNSTSIRMLAGEALADIGDDPEPPSLYIFKRPQFWGERLLDAGMEEYRCPLDIAAKGIELLSMYRCYRNAGDMEYQMGIYLIPKC